MFDSKTIKNAQNATEPASAFDKFELAEQIFLSFRRELREKGCCPTTVSGRARPCATAVFSFAPWHLPGTNDETAILHLRCKATKLDPNPFQFQLGCKATKLELKLFPKGSKTHPKVIPKACKGHHRRPVRTTQMHSNTCQTKHILDQMVDGMLVNRKS